MEEWKDVPRVQEVPWGADWHYHALLLGLMGKYNTQSRWSDKWSWTFCNDRVGPAEKEPRPAKVLVEGQGNTEWVVEADGLQTSYHLWSVIKIKDCEVDSSPLLWFYCDRMLIDSRFQILFNLCYVKDLGFITQISCAMQLNFKPCP